MNNMGTTSSSETVGQKNSLTLKNYRGDNYRKEVVPQVSYIAWLPLLIAVIGWLVAIWLQRKTSKEQLKNQIKYDIYKQIIDVEKEMQDSLNVIGTFTISDIVMKSFLIQSKNSVHSRVESIQKGWEYWNKEVKKLQDAYFKFSDSNTTFTHVVEYWGAPLREIQETRNIFWKEVRKLMHDIFNIMTDLQIASSKFGWDWEKHDRRKIDELFKQLSEKTLNLQCYIHDFVVLVHNVLLSGYFDQELDIRVPDDEQYKVLTMDGFVTNNKLKK